MTENAHDKPTPEEIGAEAFRRLMIAAMNTGTSPDELEAILLGSSPEALELVSTYLGGSPEGAETLRAFGESMRRNNVEFGLQNDTPNQNNDQ